jgi:hypothetical protein
VGSRSSTTNGRRRRTGRPVGSTNSRRGRGRVSFATPSRARRSGKTPSSIPASPVGSANSGALSRARWATYESGSSSLRSRSSRRRRGRAGRLTAVLPDELDKSREESPHLPGVLSACFLINRRIRPFDTPIHPYNRIVRWACAITADGVV